MSRGSVKFYHRTEIRTIASDGSVFNDFYEFDASDTTIAQQVFNQIPSYTRNPRFHAFITPLDSANSVEVYLSSFKIFEGGYFQSAENNKDIADSGKASLFDDCDLEMGQVEPNIKCHQPKRGFIWDSLAKGVVSCSTLIVGCKACSETQLQNSPSKTVVCHECPKLYNIFGASTCSLSLAEQCKAPEYNLYKPDRCDSCSFLAPNNCRCLQYQQSVDNNLIGNGVKSCACIKDCKNSTFSTTNYQI